MWILYFIISSLLWNSLFTSEQWTVENEMEHYRLYAVLWNSGETLYIKWLGQKKQCFHQVFTAYCEWNPRKTDAVRDCFLDSLVFCLFAGLCSTGGLCVEREGWLLCGLCHTTPFCPLGASASCHNSAVVSSFAWGHQTCRNVTSLGEDSPESVHPAEGACGLLFWCLLGATLQAVAKLPFCELKAFCCQVLKTWWVHILTLPLLKSRC